MSDSETGNSGRPKESAKSRIWRRWLAQMGKGGKSEPPITLEEVNEPAVPIVFTNKDMEEPSQESKIPAGYHAELVDRETQIRRAEMYREK